MDVSRTQLTTGSIPEKYYSVNDEAQFEAFLRDTDVLVCSLPGTPATKHLLDAKKLGERRCRRAQQALSWSSIALLLHIAMWL